MTDLSDRPVVTAGPLFAHRFTIVGESPIGAGAMIAGAHRGLLGVDDISGMERALAYSAARSDIELYCRHKRRDEAGNWFDTAEVDEDGAEHVNLAVKYLSAIKLLRRHPDNPEWVNVLPLPGVGNG